MSGTAGGGIDGQHYRLSFDSGVNEDVAPPDDDDGSYISNYFAGASAPYQRALERAKPQLDELFAEWAARGHVPIVDFDQQCEVIGGTLIPDLTHPDDEDTQEAHFRTHHRGGPCLVSVSRSIDGHGLHLQFLVTDRVRESEIEPILQEVSALLLKAYAAG